MSFISGHEALESSKKRRDTSSTAGQEIQGRGSQPLPAESENPQHEPTTAQPHLVPIECHLDDRGFLCQILGNYNEFFTKVVRAYAVGYFGQGTVRGLQMHKFETKAYFVIIGCAKFIVADSERVRQSYVLSPRSPAVLVVPPNHYHGWVSLEPSTTLIGLSDRTLEQSLNDDYRTDPMTFGAEIWTVMPR